MSDERLIFVSGLMVRSAQARVVLEGIARRAHPVTGTCLIASGMVARGLTYEESSGVLSQLEADDIVRTHITRHGDAPEYVEHWATLLGFAAWAWARRVNLATSSERADTPTDLARSRQPDTVQQLKDRHRATFGRCAP